ncbi:hypothetical protein CHU98_g155 [Xylaria longipes]|nr:hypothetical protein CHU98_g155 [Xylaria longipes]
MAGTCNSFRQGGIAKLHSQSEVVTSGYWTRRYQIPQEHQLIVTGLISEEDEPTQTAASFPFAVITLKAPSLSQSLRTVTRSTECMTISLSEEEKRQVGDQLVPLHVENDVAT